MSKIEQPYPRLSGMLGGMAQLIVISKIDGNPVAWRCSDCGEIFSVSGSFTAVARSTKVGAEFKVHVNKAHTNGKALSLSPQA
jgi:uncharacterized C2H2 Zn-finger protein